jgi:hypothetical protein
MSFAFLLTSLVIVATPGTGALSRFPPACQAEHAGA